MNIIHDMYPALLEFVESHKINKEKYYDDAVKYLCALGQIEPSAIDSKSFCFQIFSQLRPTQLPTGIVAALPSHRTTTFPFYLNRLRNVNQPANGGFCGVYVVVNETDGKGRKANNIIGVRALFVECDHGSLSDVHIAEFRDYFKPSIIVESSPGKIHCYWLLQQESCPLSKFSSCQQMLATRFTNLRAGLEAKDLPRVLRVPGFLHLKDLGCPFYTTLHHCESSWQYTPDEVFELCGIDREFVATHRASPDLGSQRGSVVSQEILDTIDPKYNEFLGASEGQRNDAMFHYCLKHLFQYRGVNHGEAIGICSHVNQVNRPPLDNTELVAIVESAWTRFQRSGGLPAPAPGLAQTVLTEWDTELPDGYTRPDGEASWEENNFSFNYNRVLMKCSASDESLADRIIQKYGSKINYSEVGGFYVYNNLIWANAHGEGRRLVRSWMGETFANVPYETEVQNCFLTPNGGLDKKRWSTFRRDIHSTSRLQYVLKALSERKEIATTPDQFNREEEADVIACPNGILNLSKGEIVPSDPKYKLTHIMGTPFDPEAVCPTWDYFISSCMGKDKKLIEYLQKITGYFLSGRTHLQCIFVAYGKSGTGKSVYLNVLHKLLAGYCKELHKTVLIAGAGSENAKMSSLAQAVHCRLGTVQELKSSEEWDETIVKALSGNDFIVAKLSHKDTVEFKPRFKICVRANDLPTSEQLDEALWTRLKFLPFEVRFRGTVDERPFLTDELNKELPGILNWAVRGYQMLLTNGLHEPFQATAQKRTSQRESEPVRMFIEECCEMVAHKDGLKYSEFHSALEQYCRNLGLPVHGKQRIRKLLFGEFGCSEINSRVVTFELPTRQININLKPEFKSVYHLKNNVIDIKSKI